MKPAALPILILNPHSRCNCRCTMCDIWKNTDSGHLTLGQVEAQMEDFERLGLQWVVLSGGEALMHPEAFAICRLFRARGMRVTVLSTGLLMARLAPSIVECVDEIIVSLDGPEPVHDGIRGIAGAFRALAEGVAAVRALRVTFPLSARCTVQRANFRHLCETVDAARQLRLDSISFLAVDVHSEAFNRPAGWSDARRKVLLLRPDEISALESELEELSDSGSFVRESPAKLRRILCHFRVEAGLDTAAAPMCNAPWVSAVVEADGTVKPCFFHAPVGRIGGGTTFLDVWSGTEARAFRNSLDVSTNEVCRRCVCSLNWTLRAVAAPNAVDRVHTDGPAIMINADVLGQHG